jgi:hypothetical protein
VLVTPCEEAAQAFSEVVANLTSSQKDLKTCLRKCQLACEILGWYSERDWFKRELEGYPPALSRPPYRIVQGSHVWEPQGSTSDIAAWVVSGQRSPEAKDAEPVSLDVWSGLDWILAAALSGYREVTEEEKQVYLRYREMPISLRRYHHFPASAFAMALSAIENHAYDFASRSYVNLRYGDILTDTMLFGRSISQTTFRRF